MHFFFFFLGGGGGVVSKVHYGLCNNSEQGKIPPNLINSSWL